nr:hypothetical protein [Tanacetum cinerariifolium]
MMPCPWTTCLNHIEHKVEEVQFHSFKYRIDLSYTKWDKHREKDEQATTAQIPVNAIIEFVEYTDFDMDFGSEIPTDGPLTVEMVNATKESFDEDDLAKFQELLLDAKKPLYKGCPDLTKLSTIVKLLNLKGRYGAFDKFFTELLGLLKKMLPADEKFPEIAKDLRNLWLGISANEVDVNSGTREQIYNEVQHIENKWGKENEQTIRPQKTKKIRETKMGRFKKNNVCESLVKTLLNVPGKRKDGMNAQLDLAKLGIKLELFSRQEEDKTTLPPAGGFLQRLEAFVASSIGCKEVMLE